MTAVAPLAKFSSKPLHLRGRPHMQRPPEPFAGAKVQGKLQEMMIGRSDERVNPETPTADRGRLSVMVSFAEPIWASGHSAASTGRTHDRRRTARQIQQQTLAPQGPSTHAAAA